MNYQTILVDVKDRVATVTINRPEVSNAFARESYGEIADAMATLGARNDVGAIVITGAGKHFSAGGDVPGPQPDPERVHHARRHPGLPQAGHRHD